MVFIEGAVLLAMCTGIFFAVPRLLSWISPLSGEVLSSAGFARAQRWSGLLTWVSVAIVLCSMVGALVGSLEQWWAGVPALTAIVFGFGVRRPDEPYAPLVRAVDKQIPALSLGAIAVAVVAELAAELSTAVA